MSEKPQNGIAGLKHWRYDAAAGLQVALVSLPLSLGIAVASGVPPITGVISAIIAGLVFPFLGGAYVTISGPAAGLAPALLAGILMLGDGDLAAGYPLLLVAIFFTGVVQILLSLFQAGKYVATFLPVTVVEAMLASIGIMIIIKQIPTMLGDLSPPAKSMLIAIGNFPSNVMRIEPEIAALGAASLVLIFVLQRARQTWLRRLPPPLTICLIGIAVGWLLDLDVKYLIAMPDSILAGGFTMPSFDVVWSRPELWGSLLVVVITLTLIDGIESLATIKAVDKIDPYQRTSHPNITLRAMGISNALSSIAGGLTIIPGGIKSRANIDAGGRTLWANFFNAITLIVFLFFAKELIARIPLAAIGAVLIYVGWRLCEVKVFSATLAIGRDRLVIFVFTVLAVLATDLLSGILLGVAAEILLLTYLLSPSLRLVLTGRIGVAQLLRQLGSSLESIFFSPVVTVAPEGKGGYRISLQSLTGFNLPALDRALSKLPPQAPVTLAFTESGRLIEHSAMEYLHELKVESLRHGRPLTLNGLDGYKAFTPHPLAARIQDAQYVKEKVRLSERAQSMAAVAKQLGLAFEPGPVATLNPHDFVYLRRGTNREERNIVSGTYGDCEVKLYDYSHTAPPDNYVEHRHTLLKVRCLLPSASNLPNFAVTPGHYLERYLVEYQEVEVGKEAHPGGNYRVFGTEAERVLRIFNDRLTGFLHANPGFYFEVRDNTLLAFRPGRELEEPDEVMEWLFAFVGLWSPSPAAD
jgi:carbonic anhydrase